MVYGDFKYLARRTASDNDLRDKAFNIAKENLSTMDTKEDWLLWLINLLIKSQKEVVLIQK